MYESYGHLGSGFLGSSIQPAMGSLPAALDAGPSHSYYDSFSADDGCESEEKHVQKHISRPKRPLTSYASFCKQYYQIIRDSLGFRASHADIMSQISKSWREMNDSQRSHFVAMSFQDRDRYHKEEEQYHQKLKQIEEYVESCDSAISPSSLQTLVQQKEHQKLASYILYLNGDDPQSALDFFQDVLLVLSKDGSTLSRNFKGEEGKYYVCDFPGCGHKSSWKSNLKVHYQTHISRARSYVCSHPNCNKAFHDKQHLKQHESIHTRTQQLYVCEYMDCGRKYGTKAGLSLHIKSQHLCDRRHQCPEPDCSSAFVRKTDLRSHLLRVHGKAKMDGLLSLGVPKAQ